MNKDTFYLVLGILVVVMFATSLVVKGNRADADYRQAMGEYQTCLAQYDDGRTSAVGAAVDGIQQGWNCPEPVKP